MTGQLRICIVFIFTEESPILSDVSQCETGDFLSIAVILILGTIVRSGGELLNLIRRF